MKIAIKFFLGLFIVSLFPAMAAAQAAELPFDEQSSSIIRTAVLLTSLAIIPALFISMTAFIRIAIVLSMVRHAFGMPETPPNQILVSLAFFLTLFVMTPTFTQVNDNALQPFMTGDITLEDAIEQGSNPMRDFMLAHTRDQDLQTMYQISGRPAPASADEVEMIVLTPAFILNELRIAFTIGFIILLPFLLIDLVVSSILLSLGMMMVPPSTISLPIKLLMFVVIDGWALIIEGVIGGFG